MSSWQEGQEHIVDITGLSHEAAGVGRIDGRVVFVRDSIPGDRAKVRLVHLKKRIGYGEVVEILKPSEDRIEPSCRHGVTCGGCQLQHMDYGAQLVWKRQQVQDAMERIGKLQAEVLPTLGMDDPYHYRNKGQFPLSLQGGEVVLGLYQKGTHEIVDLEECEIVHPLIEKLALTLKALVRRFGIEPYDEVTHQGVLRHAVIRASFSQDKLMLILVTRTKDLPHEEELIEELNQAVPELVSVIQNFHPQKSNVILGREMKLIWGDPHLIDSIGHLDYAISPGSFFQVNPLQTKVLYDLVKDRLDLTGTETIFDLYCGAGTIGLYLASSAKKIIGVETFPAAVEDANHNARLNNITNAEFVVGKAEIQLPRLVQEYKRMDAVVVDPPRKGCDPSLLETLVKSEIPRIAYVSCNPATLARDLSYLVKRGYSIGAIQPVDMFPWTSHVETVCLLTRK